MKDHDSSLIRSHILDMIQQQAYKKVEPEVQDWNGEEVEKLESSSTYTFQQEVIGDQLVPVHEDVPEGSELDDDDAIIDLYPDLNDLADVKEIEVARPMASEPESEEMEGFVRMSKNFNKVEKKELSNNNSDKKKKVASSKDKKIDPKQPSILAYYKKQP